MIEKQKSKIHRRSNSLLRSLAAALWAGVLIAGAGLHARKSKPTDYEVKAVYLFNFARLVQWPSAGEASNHESFTLCVLGQDPFGSALDGVVAGESIGGRPVVAKRISKHQDAVACRVLYVSSSEESQLKEILTALGKASVLTVSDMPEFLRRGGMVQFVTDNNRVRFEVNLANATDAGLTLSSELLKVAIIVIRNQQPGD